MFFFFFLCVQYVSALRPPKPTHHAINGSKAQTMNNRNGEAADQVEGRRRVYSLTYNSPAPAYRHNLPRRSLQNPPVSSQLSWSVDEELKKRRRLAGFDQSYGELTRSDSDSDPESGEPTETDEHEWKQVSDGKNIGSQMFNTEYVQNAHSSIICNFGQIDCGHVVERPNAPKWLHTQRGARRRLLLGGRCHRGSAGKTQPPAPHPLP